MSIFCKPGKHELKIESEAFDHEFGCEVLYYYICTICEATYDDDNEIPEIVEQDDLDDPAER